MIQRPASASSSPLQTFGADTGSVRISVIEDAPSPGGSPAAHCMGGDQPGLSYADPVPEPAERPRRTGALGNTHPDCRLVGTQPDGREGTAMARRICETGASGQAGRAVVAELLGHGYDVAATDIAATKDDLEGGMLRADLTDYGQAA